MKSLAVRRLVSSFVPLFLGAAVAASALTQSTDARACGGCFVQNESTVVTDHRMALSISKTQTVLWDQIRYTGDPREFAWVLPVRVGTKLELAHDEFFTALDAATQPVIVPPNRSGGRLGCAVAGCAASESASSAPGEGQVQIVSQAVVGPYETVTLRATDPDALTRWLKSHAFAIPTSIEPTIAAYVREGFDFIALRLAPRCGERQMRPVRVVTPGADPTLPLRMVAAGVGARVGITLYVIGEGRYHPQNFPDAQVDWESELTWSRSSNRSNYQDLAAEAMAQSGGRAWLTEFAGRVDVAQAATRRYASSFHPSLVDTYFGLCRGPGPVSSGGGTGNTTPCPDNGPSPAVDSGAPPRDAGPPRDASASDAAPTATDGGEVDGGEVDGGEVDGGEADGGEADAGTDASAPVPDAGPPRTDAGAPPAPTPGFACGLDDLAVATEGMSPSGVWVTRLRAVLPANALGAGDLRLEATSSQTPVESVHYVDTYSDEASSGRAQGCASGARSRTTFGSYGLAALAAVAGLAWARKRRRR